MRSVVDIAQAAQNALRADPFSVWVYEIHDGVQRWRPAGFTPAEWEAHQQSLFAPVTISARPDQIFTGLTDAVQVMTDALLTTLAPALQDFGEQMQQFTNAMQKIGIEIPDETQRVVMP